MGLLWRLLRGMPAYLWSGWGAAASLLLFVALWELGSAYYGALETVGSFIASCCILVLISCVPGQ